MQIQLKSVLFFLQHVVTKGPVLLHLPMDWLPGTAPPFYSRFENLFHVQSFEIPIFEHDLGNNFPLKASTHGVVVIGAKQDVGGDWLLLISNSYGYCFGVRVRRLLFLKRRLLEPMCRTSSDEDHKLDP
jgi:hypothetical protein